jgi:hypothetical protein
VTEDSELAIRIHAAGYASAYVTRTFGRGLIPETFAGYRKQRARWSAGPVQELKRHWRLFLPRPLGQPSALTPAQKLHHLNHGLNQALIGLGLLFLPLGAALISSIAWHRETISIPPVLWLTGAISQVAGLGLIWLWCWVAMGSSLWDTVGGFVARQALNHTIMTASFGALWARRLAWRRTNKFTALPAGLGALASAVPELMLALSTVLIIAGVCVAARPHGFLLMLLIGTAYQGLGYLAAPALALLAEWDIRARRAPGLEGLRAEPALER